MGAAIASCTALGSCTCWSHAATCLTNSRSEAVCWKIGCQASASISAFSWIDLGGAPGIGSSL
ncbi:hypothetical protein PF007_g20581 [Phytophthora fragariae]|uniref:Uncharacterized protein n=1 Tax=Phytophthora fragariae TaxID=53985 RepID=A0A6A3R4G2_9STRA|nr:hypothetical protein PF007_g20581 [Phytophthora fragariae]KAE9266796.1 hypothetical protein PF008_g31527 [Phytophthora fragariae]